MNTRFAGLFTVATLIVALLSACGGGGGGGGEATVTTVTTTTATTIASFGCPDGTTADTAANCPAPRVISINPADGDKTVSPDSFKGVTVATSSKLDPASITTANIKLGIGTSTNIAGDVALTADGKGFTWTLKPGTKLSYAQVYDKFTWKGVKDTLGKLLPDGTSAFTTTVDNQCLAPNVRDNVTGNCNPPATTFVIHPIGEKITTISALSSASTAVGDVAWKQAVNDGTIKKVDTGAIMTGFSTRPLVWNLFTRNLSNSTTIYCMTPTYKDDDSAIGSYTLPESACQTSSFDWAIGTSAGLILHEPALNRCGELRWNAVTLTFEGTVVTCPQ